MISQRSEQITQIFGAALERPREERSAFVSQACGSDDRLRAEVEDLLLGHERAGDFLEQPALGFLISGSSPKPHAFSVGQVLSARFEIIRFLGCGGMGEVYEARDLDLGERLALKAIRPEIACNQEVSARLKHEIRLAHLITHPNVCRLFDLERHRDSLPEGAPTAITFLTMELLRGETLAQRLRRVRRMATDEALPVIRQMAEALAAAHRVGVIHRDFKPSNVILVPTSSDDGPDGGLVRAVVTDFGLARTVPTRALAPQAALSALSSLTPTGQMVGTIAYMAPEQLDGGDITPATDIYALGLVIYEMVAGRRPFPGLPFAGALMRLRQAPPSPRVYAPELSPRWEAAILRCLEIDPAGRFQNALEAVKALCGQGKDGGGSRRPSRPAPQVRNLRSQMSAVARRRPVIVSALALAVLCAVVLSRSYPSKPGRLPQGATVLLTNVKNQTGDEQLNGVTELVRSQLAQSGRFNLLEDKRLAEILARMTKPADTPLDPVTAREVAWRGGASRVVFETLSPVADGYALEIDVQEVGSDPTTYAAHERQTFNAASKRTLFDAVRDGARWIRREAGESPQGIATADRPPEDITTPSWEALELFMQSEKLKAENRLPESISLLKQATAKDPQFAMAYMHLGNTYDLLGNYRDGYANWERALQIADSRRLTKREELRIRGVYAMDRNDMKSALAAFDAYESYYPNDYLGPLYHARPLLLLGRPEEAIRALEEAQRKNPNSVFPFFHLAGFNLVLRHFDQAAQAIARLRQMAYGETVDSADYFEGEALFMQGQYDKALAAFRRLQTAGSPYFRSRSYQLEANVLAELGRREEAIRVINQSLPADVASGRDGDRAAKLTALAYLYLAKGDRTACRTACLKALELDGSLGRSRDVGSLLAQAGYLEEARRILKSRDPGHYPPISDEVRHRLQGEILLAEGQRQKALEEFEEAAQSAPPAENREYLARALAACGRPEEAWTLYQKAVQAQGQIWYWAEANPPGFWADMLYQDGRVGRKLGKPEATDAAARYRKLREHADPDVPML
jgi:serine/threonine protein kinase/tetratricopeptide (TPR) repeat protein